MSELFIPWGHMVKSGVVGAEASEAVKVLRSRLRKLGGRGQFNAPILVRQADGSIAPTSAAMLRKVAQEQGAEILEERLEGILDELCPGPWTAEGRDAARREAQRRRLPVLVTEGRRPIGLMLPPGRLSLVVVRDKVLFDLFDEPLSREQLLTTEYCTATLGTTVAKVARDLKELREPRKAHLVVEMNDGSFQAMPMAALDAQVRRADDQVWGLPLHRFAPLLRRAERRRSGTVGRKQAQALADEAGYLVLVDDGEVVGLVVSQVIRRRAEPPGALAYHAPGEAAAADLFSVSEAELERFALEAEPEAGDRFVNLWFQDREDQIVEASRPLRVGAAYYLMLNIGQLRASSIIDWEDRPDYLPSSPEPEAVPIMTPREEWPTLYASVFSEDFAIDQPTQILTLPPKGDSAAISFEVQPLRRTYGQGDAATLDVCLYYRCSLVQSFQVQAEVRTEGEEARTRRPQRAVLKAARVEDYPDLDQVAPKELNLTITKRADGAYQFSFTLTPEAVQDPRWEAIRLGCHVNLRREDLTHLITKARRQLYNIARSPDYQGSLTGDPAAFRQAMKALATVGRQLYLQIFRLRDEHSAGAAVVQWIEEGNLPRDSKIQIVDRAGDFVFPWALVYDQSPWGDSEIEPQGFWGIRYEIELLTEGLLKRYQEVKPTIETDQVSLAVGLYDYLPGARQQRGFFERVGEAAGTRVKTDLFNSTLPLRRALEAADQHILYFFCHGFTERMAVDIQIGDDLLAEFKALFKAEADQQRAILDKGDMTHYDALFDVSDSWLQLTRGTAPLTMMEDTLLETGVRFNNGPLVFLNMCESAQVLPSLSGGFIPFFLDYGARGVLGTECPMTSTFADPFAQAFLQRFLQGQPVGRILLDLRRAFLGRGNPLGLAYTLYCDADVRLASGLPAPELVYD